MLPLIYLDSGVGASTKNNSLTDRGERKSIMKTVFIGYEKRVGSFPSKETGEIISYSNRFLRFITDSGASKSDIGFKSFTTDRLKLGELAEILGVPENDEAVDKALAALLNKPVRTSFAPKDDKMVLVWFGAE